MGHDFDDLDLKILEILQQDARISKADLARKVSLSGPGVGKRLKKLEEAGAIAHYGASVNWEALGLSLLCFIHISFDHHDPERVRAFEENIRSVPEVLECHHITGEHDYLVKAVTTTPRKLEEFLIAHFTSVREVRWLRTSVVLRTIKDSTVIRFDGREPPASES